MKVDISIVEGIKNYNLNLSCHLGPFTSEWKQFPIFFSAFHAVAVSLL